MRRIVGRCGRRKTPDRPRRAALPSGPGRANAAGEHEKDSRRSPRSGETGSPSPASLRHARAHALRHRAGTEPSASHRAANAVSRRTPVCRLRPGKRIADPECLRATAVEIASRTPRRVRKAGRPVDVPRPLVARFGNARFGPRVRASGTGAPGGRPAKGSPDAAGRWAARYSSVQGGRPRGAGGTQSVGSTCIGSAEAWSAAAVGIISALGSLLNCVERICP